MKSKQADQIIRTSCKDCIFATYKDLTQIGCVANRLDIFQQNNAAFEAYDNDKEFYVIERLCNIYRSTKNDDLQKELSQAYLQVAVNFDIIIDCSNVSTENIFSNNILKLNYPLDKITFHVINSHNIEKYKKTNILDLSRQLKSKMTLYYNYDITLHKLIYGSRKSFHLIYDMAQNIDINILNNLNDKINNQLIKFTIYEQDGIKCISNLAYKVYSFNNAEHIYSKNIDTIINDSIKDGLYVKYEK